MYLHPQVILVFTADDIKNAISLCKLDVNIKNRMAVVGSVSFFKLVETL